MLEVRIVMKSKLKKYRLLARGCLHFTHSGSQTMMHPKRTVLR